MEIYTQETMTGKPNKFVIQLSKREAQTLVEIVETAQAANKRKSSFYTWRKKIEEKLCCF